MAKSLCRLLIYVYHTKVTNFYVANMSFNAIRENKILAKISEFTVANFVIIIYMPYFWFDFVTY